MSKWQAKFDVMKRGGEILRTVVDELRKYVAEGVTTIELDKQAQVLIESKGGETSFTKVPGYQWATCLSVNEVVVHGVPSKYVLKKGDVLKLDIGVFYKGYHVDYSDVVAVGGIEVLDGNTIRFLDTGKRTLEHALTLVKPGNRVGDVSKYIDKTIHGAGYKVIQDLTGHAVGEDLHMDPLIPGIYMGNRLMQEPFLPGKAYAIEIIYSMTDSHIEDAGNDGWSLKTVDGSQSGCFENTVFVTEREGIVLI